jgi:chemosensory pili system protein ChpE
MSLLLSAFLLGLAYCAPPGAVFAETLRRSAQETDQRNAARTAWRVQIGSVIGDLVWAVVALVGAAFLVQNAVARITLGVLGALLMAWLSFSALRDAWRGVAPVARSDGQRSSLRTGLLLALANPFAVPFWLGLGAGSLAQLGAQPTTLDIVGFFTAFIAATIVYAVVISLLAGYGRRFLTQTTYRLINLACGLFLAFKALELVFTLYSDFLL